MIDIELVGHDYSHEINQIINLFFEDKENLQYKVESILENQELIYAESRIYKGNKLISQVKIEREFDKNKSELELRKLYKRFLKLSLFKALKKIINKDMPWGILTGIRPTKIVHEMVRQSFSMEEIIKILINEYEVKEEKARLLTEIVNKQIEILTFSPKNSISVYIGIPFCPTRCLYCSFTSNSVKKYGYLIDDYLKCLFKEIDEVNKIIKDKGYTIQTIYIGGGTPTTLNIQQLEKFFVKLKNTFGLNNISEITIEAGRPDTITKEKLKLIKQFGIERISINPQTMNEETLCLIKRMHTPHQIIDSYNLAREIGFSNINMDIIVGLPGEDEKYMVKTMEKIYELSPDNLTVHTMSIKRASDLKQNIKSYNLIDKNTVENMLDIAAQYAYKMNMYPYYLYRQKNTLGNFENTGYCKWGKECIYNIQIMEEKQSIIALGAGGVSKLVYDNDRIERIFNVKNAQEYIKRNDEMIEKKRHI